MWDGQSYGLWAAGGIGFEQVVLSFHAFSIDDLREDCEEGDRLSSLFPLASDT
jgi:hypothetical protein